MGEDSGDGKISELCSEQNKIKYFFDNNMSPLGSFFISKFSEVGKRYALIA